MKDFKSHLEGTGVKPYDTQNVKNACEDCVLRHYVQSRSFNKTVTLSLLACTNVNEK